MKRRSRQTKNVVKKKVKLDHAAINEEREKVTKALMERLESHDENRVTVQDELHGLCDRIKKQIEEMEDKINSELEEKFAKEDNRLQTALNSIQTLVGAEEINDDDNNDSKEEDNDSSDDNNDSESHFQSILNEVRKAKGMLMAMQSYKLNHKYMQITTNEDTDLSELISLDTKVELMEEWVELKAPEDLTISRLSAGRVHVKFHWSLNQEEEKSISENKFEDVISFKAIMIKENEAAKSEKCDSTEPTEYPIRKERGKDSFSFVPDSLEPGVGYSVKVCVVCKEHRSEWSKEAKLENKNFYLGCVWRECPKDAKRCVRYSVNKSNHRVVSMPSTSGCATVMGTSTIPLNTTVSWNIKILKSLSYFGGPCVGVALSDLNMPTYFDIMRTGWYFNCSDSTLRSGPPHNYNRKEYGPRKERGQYVHTGDRVGVVMDTVKGNLSFVLNGVNLGVAYEGIPLDKPLVPCVILFGRGESVELEIKDN